MNIFKKHIVLITLAAMLLIASLMPCMAMAEYSIKVDKKDLSVTQGLDKNWMNILLIGTDSRANLDDEGRSDTMIICSIHKKTNEIKLTSLARDMWVKIPGVQSKQKLNAAHRYGGPNLLMKTINELFDMNITQYVSVNFYGLSAIIDSMGGVDVEISSSEASYINSYSREIYGGDAPDRLAVKDQTAHLNGTQALAYARIRKLDNDFGRTARQRKLLSAVAGKVKGMGFFDQVGLFTQGQEYLSTNVNPMDLISIGTGVLGGDLQISDLSLPVEFNYDNNDGISKVVFDQAGTTKTLHEFIYGE